MSISQAFIAEIYKSPILTNFLVNLIIKVKEILNCENKLNKEINNLLLVMSNNNNNYNNLQLISNKMDEMLQSVHIQIMSIKGNLSEIHGYELIPYKGGFRRQVFNNIGPDFTYAINYFSKPFQSLFNNTAENYLFIIETHNQFMNGVMNNELCFVNYMKLVTLKADIDKLQNILKSTHMDFHLQMDSINWTNELKKFKLLSEQQKRLGVDKLLVLHYYEQQSTILHDTIIQYLSSLSHGNDDNNNNNNDYNISSEEEIDQFKIKLYTYQLNKLSTTNEQKDQDLVLTTTINNNKRSNIIENNNNNSTKKVKI